MSYTRDVLLFRIKDLNFWKKEHSETLMSQILEKNRRELAETDIKIASYKKFISICNKGFWGRMLYVLRPTKEWLHSNMVYRLYNVLKMYDLVSDKPKRKTHSMEIVSKPNNEIIKLTSVDFWKTICLKTEQMRNSNIEIVRFLSMAMIIIGHLIGFGVIYHYHLKILIVQVLHWYA